MVKSRCDGQSPLGVDALHRRGHGWLLADELASRQNLYGRYGQHLAGLHDFRAGTAHRTIRLVELCGMAGVGCRICDRCDRYATDADGARRALL